MVCVILLFPKVISLEWQSDPNLMSQEGQANAYILGSPWRYQEDLGSFPLHWLPLPSLARSELNGSSHTVYSPHSTDTLRCSFPQGNHLSVP